MKTLTGIMATLTAIAIVRVLPIVAVGATALFFAVPSLFGPGSLQQAALGSLDGLARHAMNLDPRPHYRTISVLDGRTLASEIALRRQVIMAGAEIKRIGD